MDACTCSKSGDWIHKPPSEPDLDGSSVAMMSDFQAFVVSAELKLEVL